MAVSAYGVDVLRVKERVREDAGPGPVWAYGGEDLNANLMVFENGAGVAGHVNNEVDVLMVGMEGQGTLVVNGQPEPFGAGSWVVVPKGVQRAIRSGQGRLVYLTCHRQRGGLSIQPRRY